MGFKNVNRKLGIWRASASWASRQIRTISCYLITADSGSAEVLFIKKKKTHTTFHFISQRSGSRIFWSHDVHIYIIPLTHTLSFCRVWIYFLVLLTLNWENSARFGKLKRCWRPFGTKTFTSADLKRWSENTFIDSRCFNGDVLRVSGLLVTTPWWTAVELRPWMRHVLFVCINNATESTLHANSTASSSSSSLPLLNQL